MTRLRFLLALVAFLLVGRVPASLAAQSTPVDVTGKWAFAVTTENGTGYPTVTLKQEGEKLTLEGRSQSNSRVSTYMRNLEGSGWMTNPDLSIIEAKAMDGASAAASRPGHALPYVFTLKVKLANPSAAGAEAEADASGAAAPAAPAGNAQPAATTPPAAAQPASGGQP